MTKILDASAHGIQIRGMKFVLGMLLAPLFLSVVWCPPLELADFLSSTYILLLTLNLLTAYPDFAFHFFLSHLLVKKLKLPLFSGYLLIIALLSAVSAAVMQAHHFRGINGLGYQGVVVLKDGAITSAGILFALKASATNVLGHCGAVLILLYIYIFGKSFKN